MTTEVINLAALRAAIILVACISLYACDDTTKRSTTEANSMPIQTSEVSLNPTGVSEPLLREAGEGKDYEWGKDHIFIKLSRAETGGILTLIQDNLKPGFDLGMHFHRTHTEIFYILEGEVNFTTYEDAFTAKTGSVVYLPAGTPHAANSLTGGRMLMFYSPGGFDGMLAEIENASWLERINPFAKARRDEKYDFHKGADVEPIAADAPKPKFIEGGKGENTTLASGTSTIKLSHTETHGLTTMTEETLKPGVKRVSSLADNQAEVLFVLEGKLEFTVAKKTQKANAGATLYFPIGVNATVKSSAGAKFISYRTAVGN